MGTKITDQPGRTWANDSFVRSYRMLDEDWLTKQMLYREACEILMRLVPETDAPLRVLDLGGGLGTMALHAQTLYGVERFAHWTVFDMAFTMMAAGRVFRQDDAPFVRFAQGNMLRGLPFVAGSFDAVVSSNVFYLFDDNRHMDPIAPEITRVLVPDGVLLAVGPTPDAQNSHIIAHEVSLRAQGRNRVAARFSVLRDVAANLGFLQAQRKLRVEANKKPPERWADLYIDASERTMELVHAGYSEGYAGQAGIWAMRRLEAPQPPKLRRP